MFKHITPIQLRFNDIDRLGHVNNNAYFEYYDIGKEKYLHDVLKVDYVEGAIVPVIAHIETDFFSPIFYGDNVEIRTRVSHLGTKSFTLEQEAVSLKDGSVKCRCSTVMVCFDKKTQASVPFPEEYKQAIVDFEGEM